MSDATNKLDRLRWPMNTLDTRTDAQVGTSVLCPRCGVRLMFRRSLNPRIDACGFESYTLACKNCGASLGGVIDPYDDALLLSEIPRQYCELENQRANDRDAACGQWPARRS